MLPQIPSLTDPNDQYQIDNTYNFYLEQITQEWNNQIEAFKNDLFNDFMQKNANDKNGLRKFNFHIENRPVLTPTFCENPYRGPTELPPVDELYMTEDNILPGLFCNSVVEPIEEWSEISSNKPCDSLECEILADHQMNLINDGSFISEDSDAMEDEPVDFTVIYPDIPTEHEDYFDEQEKVDEIETEMKPKKIVKRTVKKVSKKGPKTTKTVEKIAKRDLKKTKKPKKHYQSIKSPKAKFDKLTLNKIIKQATVTCPRFSDTHLCCPIDDCNFKTIRKDNLVRHLKGQHGLADEQKEFRCQFCNYKCLRTDNLMNHVKNKHKNEYEQIRKND